MEADAGLDISIQRSADADHLTSHFATANADENIKFKHLSSIAVAVWFNAVHYADFSISKGYLLKQPIYMVCFL